MSSIAPTPPPKPRLTSDEFIAWAMTLPDGEHYELADGELIAMSPQRASHARVKARAWQALARAVEAARSPCEAFPDGLSVVVDEYTTYEPDALVRCGDPLDGDTVKLSDPVIVVEVISPSSRSQDTGIKLADYFRLPSVQHYLVLNAKSRMVIHHQRESDGRIRTAILRHGELKLDPPGLTVPLAAFFA